jgi:hypothetical protein
MSNTVQYQFRSQISILNHFGRMPHLLVRDADEEADMLREARIRSGDYLMTVATELDQLAQSLAKLKAPEAHELERLVAELLYVERNYTIVKRS